MRWLHIYLSMIGLATILFFSATGITLNHPDLFLAETERTQNTDGRMETRWLNKGTSTESNVENNDIPDPATQVDKFEIVEHLRKRHGIHGEVADLRVDDRECMVAFKGPGYSADTYIERATGKYTLTQNRHGLVAILNDLHKGRDSGPVWSWVIDISAGMMVIVSLSGLLLLFYIKRRRISGTWIMVVGTILIVALYWFGVP